MIRKGLKIVGLVLSVLVLSGCSDSSSDSYSPETLSSDSSSSYNSESEPPIDEPLFVDEEPLTFNGYECTDDCSGHEAGYNWAEENGITDPSDCGGNSNSFIEGCESYGEEQSNDDSYGDN